MRENSTKRGLIVGRSESIGRIDRIREQGKCVWRVAVVRDQRVITRYLTGEPVMERGKCSSPLLASSVSCCSEHGLGRE